MINELIDNIYFLVMSGLCISGVIAALFCWYAISVDLKEKDDFDKKYRESRDVKGRWN